MLTLSSDQVSVRYGREMDYEELYQEKKRTENIIQTFWSFTWGCLLSFRPFIQKDRLRPNGVITKLLKDTIDVCKHVV